MRLPNISVYGLQSNFKLINLNTQLMKTILTSCLLAAFTLFGSVLMAQTAIVGPGDQYAFQWENFGGTVTPIGLYFSSSEGEFQFRDNSGATRLSIAPGTGFIQAGTAFNYARFDANGNLRFFGNSDYLVGNNEYAFRSTSDPDNGLFFNVADNQYEFRSNSAVGTFTITANSSGGGVSGSFASSGDGDIAGGLEVSGTGSSFSSFASNGSTSDGGPLAVGPRSSSHITFDNNEVQTYLGSNAVGTFYSQFYGGNMDICNDFGGGGTLSVGSAALFVDGLANEVGIGTSGPVAPLHVATGTDVSLSQNGYQMWGIQNGLNIAIDNNEIHARDNGVGAPLTINQDGGNVIFSGLADINVGVGTSTPDYTMHITYPSGVSGHGLAIQNDLADGPWQQYQFSTNDLTFYFNGTQKGSFDDVSGNYVPSSDVRFKDDIEYIEGGMLSVINELEPTMYHFKDDQTRERKYYGLIAQDVQEVLPSIVHYYDESDRYGVSYTELIPVLIEAIQELDVKAEEGASAERISRLEAENERLAEMIEELKVAVTACCSVDLGEERKSDEGAYLGQNIPNPFEGMSVIPYFLPEGSINAVITITDMTGKIAGQYEVSGAGFGQLNVSATGLASGTYLYNMVVDGKLVDTKRMVLAQ